MIKKDPRQLIEQSGLFKTDSFDWILEIILNNMDASSSAIDLMIRTTGELISSEEKKKLGLRANAKISNKYLNSLTDKGREDILGSAFLVIHRILHAYNILREHEQILKLVPDAKDTYEAEVMVINNEGDEDEDGGTCKAAMALQGKRFKFDEAPDLPLPTCDADSCRCMFLYYKK